MKKAELMQWKKRLEHLFRQYKYVLLVILVGVVLLLLPPLWEKEDAGEEEETQTPQEVSTEDSAAALERRLEEALSRIQGVGEADVILTLKSGPQKILAQDSETSIGERGTEASVSSVIISGGSGEEAIVVQQLSPQYQGALVICSGGDDPEVRLRLVEAVSALTGLGADKISVCKGK